MQHIPTIASVLAVALSVASSSCMPFGDCWPMVTANVKVSPEVHADLAPPLVVAGAPQIYDEDVSGVDAQGVPITSKGLTPFDSTQLGTARAATVAFRGFPYPTWYIAFLDSNDNKRLDPGEPFGVDPENPRAGTCAAYTLAIEINSISTAARE